MDPKNFWILLPSTPTPLVLKTNNVGGDCLLTIMCVQGGLRKNVGSIYQPLKSKSFPQAKNYVFGFCLGGGVGGKGLIWELVFFFFWWDWLGGLTIHKIDQEK